MNNATETTSATEDLAYIRRIMEQSRRAVILRGDAFIIWGVVVFLGLIGNYLFTTFLVPGWAWGAMWAGLMVIGWTLTLLWARRVERNARCSTPAERLLGAVWLGCSIAMAVLGFAGIPLGVMPATGIGPATTAIAGIGVFLTGCLMGVRWVRNLAFVWWAIAVIECIWHGREQFLIGAVVMVLFFIVPGIILKRQARNIASDQ